jgi:histidinol dehydrogenase
LANPIFHKALLAVDESEQSYRAVEKTAELAAAGVIENLVLFNVYDSGSVDVTKLHSREKLDELRQNSMALLKKYKGILKEKGVHCTLKRAGLYVPGGTAAYPSSVLMNAIPAQVAGVEEIAMVTPPESSYRPHFY